MSFRETALKLRELLYDWLWHSWIRLLTAHWRKFKTGTFDVNTILIVWDHANRNSMEGPKKTTCERAPKLGCSVALALFNPTVRTDAESKATDKPRPVLCEFWRSFSTAKDCAEWDKALM